MLRVTCDPPPCDFFASLTEEFATPVGENQLSCRFFIYLKHNPSFGNSGSKYVLNTPAHLAMLLHHLSETRPLVWRVRYIKHAHLNLQFVVNQTILNTPVPPHLTMPVRACILNTTPHLAISVQDIKHGPSLATGDSGSTYILNTPFHLAMEIQYIYIYILNTPPHLAMQHAPSLGDSGSTYILNTPPHLAIPVHHIS